jgi:hypothetical protein
VRELRHSRKARRLRLANATEWNRCSESKTRSSGRRIVFSWRENLMTRMPSRRRAAPPPFVARESSSSTPGTAALLSRSAGLASTYSLRPTDGLAYSSHRARPGVFAGASRRSAPAPPPLRRPEGATAGRRAESRRWAGRSCWERAAHRRARTRHGARAGAFGRSPSCHSRTLVDRSRASRCASSVPWPRSGRL